MTEFILSEALAGKPVVTRDGRKGLRIVHWPELGEFSVIASIEGHEEPQAFRVDGTYSNQKSSWDLFMMTQETRTVWVNRREGGHYEEFRSEEDARHWGSESKYVWSVIAHKVEVPA